MIDSSTLLTLAGLCMTSASLVLVFLSLALGERERLQGVLELQVVIVRNSPVAILSLFVSSFISIFGALPQLEDIQNQVFDASIFLVFVAALPIIYITLIAVKVLLKEKYLGE